MLSAAIDVGSNTIRMLIGKIQDNALSRVHSDRAITRLAEGVSSSGTLAEKNMERSISVLEDFSRSIKSRGVGKVAAVGTSALREAENSRSFTDRVFQKIGIRIDVISGDREAELTAEGCLLGLGETGEPAVIIDIGGGSTEWILADAAGHKPSLSGSIPIGVVNLCEKFPDSDPPDSAEVSSINGELDSRLLPVKSEVLKRAGSISRIIGTGGTITTLAAVDMELKKYAPEKIHMHQIPLRRLYGLRDKFLSLPLKERKEIGGLEPERADLIIPGILLTIKFMEIFGSPDITVSDYGLLEGLLKEIGNEDSF